jgi:hypothetical protein
MTYIQITRFARKFWSAAIVLSLPAKRIPTPGSLKQSKTLILRKLHGVNGTDGVTLPIPTNGLTELKYGTIRKPFW